MLEQPEIAACIEQVLLTSGDSPDRAAGLRQLASQFEPGAVVALALNTPHAP